MKSRRGTAIDKKTTGGRRGRERGAGGRARCVWWPRCALLGCAALKSAHLSSRQRVPRRALRKEPRSDFFSWFLNENEFELRHELTWHVDLGADQLVGPVVALAEQNVIDLAPAPCLAAHLLYKQTPRGIAAEGETEAL